MDARVSAPAAQNLFTNSTGLIAGGPWLFQKKGAGKKGPECDRLSVGP